jgi:excinuclease ABC subunit B
MAEELTKYLSKMQIKVRFIHSEVETMERVEILRELRIGGFDVLVGVNLLREGLDLPEVSLVAVLDADKEGFLRNDRSLTQTAGRAARNANGLVIFYADKMTESMQRTIDETERRRAIQMAYNEKEGITPETVFKSKEEIMQQRSILDIRGGRPTKVIDHSYEKVAEPEIAYLDRDQVETRISQIEKKMRAAAKDLDFILAAQYRDEIVRLKKKL